MAILDVADTKNVTQALQGSYPNQNVIFIKTDVTKKEEVKSAFSQVIAKFNYIDYVVANAGILRESDYEMTIKVNLVRFIYSAIP